MKLQRQVPGLDCNVREGLLQKVVPRGVLEEESKQVCDGGRLGSLETQPQDNFKAAAFV